MAEIVPTREGYDRWAEIYDGEANPLVELEEVHVGRLLGAVRALDVVDVGCGTGRHALRLAQAGARVTAVDFSGGMLARARAKPGAELVTFVEHDLAAPPLPLPARAFDRVLCALVVDHIAELRAFFAELERLARPGGVVVVSVMHPAMMLKGIQARFRDPRSDVEVRPASAPNQISDYVLAALAAGLCLEHMSEHAVDGELAARVPRAAKYLGWPLLLLFGLRAPE